MIISVASGKGGTGKTTVATSLALSIGGDVQLVDCDVEEPNAHLFLNPVIDHTDAAVVPVPEIDLEKCTYCGRCREVCAYGALAVAAPAGDREGSVLVFSNLCHGCGACEYFCPAKAIKEVDREIGVVETCHVESLGFVQGRLNLGEAMAPPLIRQVKNRINPRATVIIDAPPGTSCPVVESVRGCDFCILVTEPTPFGLHDLKISVEVLKKLALPFGVVINRCGLGDDRTETYCRDGNIPILMKIPFKKEIAAAYSRGDPVVTAFPEYREMFTKLHQACRLFGDGEIL
jgi:MinD superfamily P-loop ATPase